MITTNLLPILLRFRDIAFDRSKIAIFGYYPLVFYPTDGAVPYNHIIVSDISLKSRKSGLHIYVVVSLVTSSTTFCAVHPESYRIR